MEEQGTEESRHENRWRRRVRRRGAGSLNGVRFGGGHESKLMQWRTIQTKEGGEQMGGGGLERNEGRTWLDAKGPGE